MIRPFRWEKHHCYRNEARCDAWTTDSSLFLFSSLSLSPPVAEYDHDAARQWRDRRSLLETIRAFRSQINSLSRLWSHPRGVAGSRGIVALGIMVARGVKAPWPPYAVHARRHACWPQLYDGPWVRESHHPLGGRIAELPVLRIVVPLSSLSLSLSLSLSRS